MFQSLPLVLHKPPESHKSSVRRWAFVYSRWASSSISCIIVQGEFPWPQNQKRESFFSSLLLPVVTETQLEAGIHHCTQLFHRLKPGQPLLPTIIQLVRMKMRLNITKEPVDRRWQNRCFGPEKKGRKQRIMGVENSPFFWNLIPIGGIITGRQVQPTRSEMLTRSFPRNISVTSRRERHPAAAVQMN